MTNKSQIILVLPKQNHTLNFVGLKFREDLISQGKSPKTREIRSRQKFTFRKSREIESPQKFTFEKSRGIKSRKNLLSRKIVKVNPRENLIF